MNKFLYKKEQQNFQRVVNLLRFIGISCQFIDIITATPLEDYCDTLRKVKNI